MKHGKKSDKVITFILCAERTTATVLRYQFRLSTDFKYTILKKQCSAIVTTVDLF